MPSAAYRPITVPAGSVTGLTAGQVLYGTSGGGIGQEAALSYDATNDRLSVGEVGNSEPIGAPVDFYVRKTATNVFVSFHAIGAAARTIGIVEAGEAGTAGTHYSLAMLRAHGASYVETAWDVSMAGAATLHFTPITRAVVGTYNSTPLIFGTNNATRMTIAADGAVSVAGALDVTGIVTHGTRQVIASDGGNVYLGPSTAIALRLLTNNLVRLYIDSNGNVARSDNSAALATGATNGFFYLPSCAGTPTGAPTAIPGALPAVIDSTNHKLYFYSGGSWRDAGP